MPNHRKPPYVFPHRSAAAMIEFLADRRGYQSSLTRYPFSWNVKLGMDINWQRPAGQYELDPALDGAWGASDHYKYIDAAAIEQARQTIDEGAWTSWPGDDQGDWKFVFLGRSAGHLCLAKWRGHSLADMSSDELRSWLRDLPRADLRRFYRGIVCADADFAPDRVRTEIEWQANFVRGQWESELKETRDAASTELAARMQADRPDLYECVGA